MPFGLRNAFETFQRTMGGILATVKCQFALLYLDDADLFSITPDAQNHHIMKVLPFLYNAGITSKLEK